MCVYSNPSTSCQYCNLDVLSGPRRQNFTTEFAEGLEINSMLLYFGP
jgi:hypothetical protein